MKFKKRDRIIIGIIFIVFIVLIAIVLTTNNNISDNNNDDLDGNFNGNNKVTSDVEIIDIEIKTYWQRYHNHSTIHFYEDGFYHDLPTDYFPKNVAYSINASVKNTGNTDIKYIQIKAVFYDGEEGELFSEDQWIYELSHLETRDFNIYSSKSANEESFNKVESMEFVIVEIIT